MHTTRLLSSGFLAGLTLLLAGAVSAVGFEPIDPPQNTRAEDQVEVVEFFWLGCPHCYQFEPLIEEWAAEAPEHVAFRREAPPLNPSWEQHSRGFYAAQVLGEEDAFVEAMFEAIHEERRPMRRPDDIADLAGTLGMDRDLFLKTMNSFAVETRLRQAIQLAQGSGISGVPAVTINGKYRTGARVAGGNQAVIETIEQQVEAESKALGIN